MKKPPSYDDVAVGLGLGILISSFAIGSLYGSGWGWLALGGLLLFSSVTVASARWVMGPIVLVAFLPFSSCSSGPAERSPRDAEVAALLDVVRRGGSNGGAVRAAVTTPPWAFPGRFEFRGVCRLQPGAVRENGERVGERETFQPRGYCTDGYAWRDGELLRMDFNHAVWVASQDNWATSIWHTTSRDGLVWSLPKPIVLPTEHERGWATQYETPAHLEVLGQHIRAALTYRYTDPRRTVRSDSLTFWRGDTVDELAMRFGGSIESTTPWEQPVRGTRGLTLGGPHEPTLLGPYGQWVLCVYSGASYYQGRKPSLMLAGTRDGGQTWVKLPDPILQDNESWGGVGQPHVTVDPRGGFHCYTQRRIGETYQVRHYYSAGDLTRWTPNPRNPVFANDTEGWRGRVSAPSVLIEERDGRLVHRMWFFGDPEAGDTRRAPHWFGMAEYLEDGNGR